MRALVLAILAAMPVAAQEWGSQPHVVISPVPAVMLFVDFPDAPATETTAALYERIVPQTRQWLSESSNGRLILEVKRADTWYRVPLTSAAYGLDALTFERSRCYLQDAAPLADANVDFSAFDVLLVVSSAGAKIPVSPAFLASPGFGVQTAEKEMRWAVTVEASVQTGAGPVVVHPAETGADPASMDCCGPKYDAPFDPGVRYVDGDLSIERLSANRVRVVRGSPHKRRSARH